MDCYDLVWKLGFCMDFYGVVWIAMVLYGY